MILSVINEKGGVGKTTIAVNIAAILSKLGRRVLLVDADPQASSLAWSSARELDPLFTVVGMAKPTLHRDLPDLAQDYAFVIIDGARRGSELGRSVVLASDAERQTSTRASWRSERRSAVGAHPLPRTSRRPSPNLRPDLADADARLCRLTHALVRKTAG